MEDGTLVLKEKKRKERNVFHKSIIQPIQTESRRKVFKLKKSGSDNGWREKF